MLILKTIAGFLAQMLILGLPLFASAGSLLFWQAWVYLGVWSAVVILITVYLATHDRRLLASRVQAGPAAEHRRSQQIIQSLASLFFIGLFVVSGLDFRFGWSHVPPVASWISDAFVAVGFYIVFRVFRENSFTSATIEVADEQKVVTTGPYRIVRHPMYFGAGLLLVFTAPALGSWVALPCSLAVMLVIVVRLLDEEKFLRKSLGGYADYAETVRYRLIPGIW